MYLDQCYRYVNFPQIPKEILEKINWNLSEYQRKAFTNYADSYLWSDDFNQEIDQWGKANICDSMYFAFQIISADLAMHKDRSTKIKLSYILQTGGPRAATEWYNDQEELIQSAVLEPFRWHIFKADTYHAVKNIDPGQSRFSITARIFP